jgi:predicted RNase H-like nuclease (RuvC/YqgF family)
VAETEHHVPPSTLFDEIPEDVENIDWETVDRLIILLSLNLARGVIRKRAKWNDEIKERVLDRMQELIGEYREPRRKK